MALTALTVYVANLDLRDHFGLKLGPSANTAAALGTAGLKATLVVLYFMDVRHSPRLVQLVVAGAFIWLLILFFITLNDYASRGWMGS